MVGRTSTGGEAIFDALVARLRSELARRGDGLSVVHRLHWVALRSRRLAKAFAEVRLRRHHLEIYVLPSPREMGGVGRLVSAVPPSRGWGWFCGRMVVRDATLEGPVAALLTSYDTLGARRPRIYRHRA